MILFNEQNKVFTIHTANSTYQMKVSQHGHLLHLYYGKRIADEDVSYLIPNVVRSHESNPAEAGVDRVYSLCAYPQEFSGNDAEVRALAERLLKTEENNMEQMKKFL